MVDVGDNGDVSQMFVLHNSLLLLLWQGHAGAPRSGARRMARTSVLPFAKPWRRRNSVPPSIYIKRGPRRASALRGGLAVVHVGDNGDVSQMFVLQKNDPFLSGWIRIKFTHNSALYAVLSGFASRSPSLFQKNPWDFAIFSKKQRLKWPPGPVFGNFSGRSKK